jgi:bifunctional non-homologous end joining protein LigD
MRDQFGGYVEAMPRAAHSAGPREKNATWLQPGERATVRHLKGSDKLRHASIKSLLIDHSDVP